MSTQTTQQEIVVLPVHLLNYGINIIVFFLYENGEVLGIFVSFSIIVGNDFLVL